MEIDVMTLDRHLSTVDLSTLQLAQPCAVDRVAAKAT